jgi:hypothetical protein
MDNVRKVLRKVFNTQIGRWIMSERSVIVLRSHRHKCLDPTPSWCIPPLHLSPSSRYPATSLRKPVSCVPIIHFCFLFAQVQRSDSYTRVRTTWFPKKDIVHRLKGHGCKEQFDSTIIKSQGSSSNKETQLQKKRLRILKKLFFSCCGIWAFGYSMSFKVNESAE